VVKRRSRARASHTLAPGPPLASSTVLSTPLTGAMVRASAGFRSMLAESCQPRAVASAPPRPGPERTVLEKQAKWAVTVPRVGGPHSSRVAPTDTLIVLCTNQTSIWYEAPTLTAIRAVKKNGRQETSMSAWAVNHALKPPAWKTTLSRA